MKIVIADDSSMLRKRIKDQLSNYKNIEIVGEADNGTEALKIIVEKLPDVAILDVRMPEMNGIEVLIKIREKKIDVKVFMLTNYPYKQYRDRCLAEGADGFFDKNGDMQEVIDFIMST